MEEKDKRGVVGEENENDGHQLRETLIDKLYSVNASQKQPKSSPVASTPIADKRKDLKGVKRTVKVSLSLASSYC